MDKKGSKYVCEKCGKEFKHKGHLNRHYQKKTPCVNNNVGNKINELGKKLKELEDINKFMLDKIEGLEKKLENLEIKEEPDCLKPLIEVKKFKRRHGRF